MLPSLRSLVVFAVFVMSAAPSWAQTLTVTNNPNLGTYSIGPVQIPLTASGGTPPYAWSHTGGSLPPGVAVSSQVLTWFPAGSTAGILGVATSAGASNFTVMVTDALGATASQTFDLSVSNLMVAGTWDLPQAFVGVSYDHQFSVLGAAGPVTFAATSTLPAGLSLTANGHLTGTPAAGSSGFYSINFSVSDGTGTVYKGHNLSVYRVRITTAGVLPNPTAGVAYSHLLSASGGTAPYTWSSFSLPFGATLASNGTLNANLQPGNYRFSATVTDSGGFQHSRNLELNVPTAPAGLPNFNPNSNIEHFTLGELTQWGFQVNGGVAPYTWSASGLPDGLQLFSGDSPRYWVWPSEAEIGGVTTSVGPITFTLSVTDSSSPPITVTRTITITSTKLWRDWNIGNGTKGVAFDQTFRVNGGVPPYSAELIRGTLPTGLTFDENTLRLSGTPLEWGSFNPTFQITDNAGHEAIKNFNTFINNDGSTVGFVYQSSLFDVIRGNFASFSPLGYGAAALTFAVESGALPDGMTISGNALSGTPTFSGTYQFRIRVSETGNPANYAVRDFRLVVTPVFGTTGYTLPYGNVGVFYAQSLAASGGTPPYSWALDADSALPPGLTFTPEGLLSGLPTSAGLFNFSVQAHDTLGNSRSTSFELPIYPAGAQPPLTIVSGPHLGHWNPGLITPELQASGGNGVYTWELISGSLPPGTAIRRDAIDWWWNPASSGVVGNAVTPGTYVFTARVTSNGATATRTFTVVVTTLDNLDCCTLPDAFVGEPYSYTLLTNSAVPLTWSMNNNTMPAGLTLNANGTITGTPTVAGFQNPGFRAFSGTENLYHNYNITVWDIQVTTPGLLPNGLQGSPYTATFEATGGSGLYTWSATGLPFGMSLSTDGVLTGTTTSIGGFTLSITATDELQHFYTKRFTLGIIAVPLQLPRITTSNDLDDASVGNTRSYGFFASGGTPPYTWSIQDPPPGMDLRPIGSQQWPIQTLLSGTPPTAGSYTFELSMTDSSSPPVTTTRSYTLRVSELHHWCCTGVPTATAGLPYSGRLRVVGGTEPYTFQLVGGKMLAGLTLQADGTMTGTPLEGGSPSMQVLVTDALGRELRFRTNVFAGSGVSSTVQHNSFYQFTGSVGRSFSTTLSACCLPSYSWTLEPGAVLPPGMSLSSAGQLSGTPTAVGVYRFLVRVFDPSFPTNNQIREFEFNVAAHGISGSSLLTYGNVGTPYTAILTASNNAGTVAATWVVRNDSQLPPGMSLASDGVLSGTPSSAGRYFFTVLSTFDGTTIPIFYTLDIYPAGAFPPLFLGLGPNLGPYQIGKRTFSTAATGGVPPYTYAIAPGADEIPGMRVIQPGQPLPVNVTGSGLFSFAGVITEPGLYTTVIRVTDSVGVTFDRAITITIAPITITSPRTLPDAVGGVPYTHTLSATGGTGPYLWTTDPLPGGWSLSADGVLSNSPVSLTPGGLGFRIRVTDTNGNVSEPTNVFWTIHHFEITSSGVLPTANQGTAYSTTLVAPGCITCTWSIASGSLPSGITLSAAGVVSGTTTSFTSSQFVAQATDTSALPGTRSSRKPFTLHIRPNTPQPVHFETTSLQDTVIGSSYLLGMNVRGGTTPHTVALVDGDLPPGMVLAGGEGFTWNSAPEKHYIAGVPTEVGDYTFTLEATDSLGATVTRTFDMHVAGMTLEYTSLPLFGTSLVYDTAYSQQHLALGGTGPYTWSAATLPSGLSISGAGLITGAPQETGSISFPIRVTDSAGDGITSSVNFNIASGTGARLSISNSADLSTFALGSASTISLTASGSPLATPEYTFSVAPGSSLPPGFAILDGSAALNSVNSSGTGTVLAFTAQATGTYTFTLMVQDADGNFGAKTHTIRIAPNTYFTTSLLEASVGVPYSQSLVAWGGSPTWSLGPNNALPPGLSLNAAGQLTGTPTTAGNYSFVLSVTDGVGPPLTRTYSLRVSTIGLSDDKVLPVAVIGTAYSYSFNPSGGTGAYLFTTTSSMPNGLTLAANGVISGTATATQTFNFTLTVSDGISSLARLFSLATRPASPTLLGTSSNGAQTQYLALGQSTTVNLNARFGRPPYDLALAPGSTLPAGLVLIGRADVPSNFAPNISIVAGTPTTVGTSTTSFVVTDSAGAQSTLALTLIVSPLSFSSGSPHNAILGQPYEATLTTIGGTAPHTFALVEETLLPTGLALSSGGVISGTPIDTGSFTFQVQTTDASGFVFRRSYTMSVNRPSGTPLQLSTNTFGDLNVGVSLSTNFTVSNGTGTVTWAVEPGSTLPPGLSLLSGASLPPTSPVNSAQFVGAPTAAGDYAFALRADDAAGNSGVRTYRMVVTPVQLLLTVLRDATLGAPYASDALQVTGVTPPYIVTLAPFITSQVPPGLSLSNAGILSGVPTTTGFFQVAINIADAAGSRLRRTLSLNVLNPGQAAPLIATNISGAFSSGVSSSRSLDPSATGGIKPYTWSVAAGSSLPPGLSILPGEGEASAYILGSPTTSEAYSFALEVHDASGQSSTSNWNLSVSPIVLSPDPFQPQAIVGAPFSITFAATGGTAPHSVRLAVPTSVPPGLTFNNGVLSGTPTLQGRFNMVVIGADSTGAELLRTYQIGVDAAATPTPYLGFDQALIALTYTTGGAAPPPVPVQVRTLTTPVPFSARLAGIPTATLSLASGTTPDSTSIQFTDLAALAALAPGVYHGVVEATAPSTINRFVRATVRLTVITPPPCVYTLGALAATASVNGGSGNIALTTTSVCNWTAVSDVPWITVTTGSGAGSASIGYVVASNAGNIAQRSGTITVGTQTFTITQFGTVCSLSLNPLSIQALAGSSTPAVRVNASASGCSWSASSSDTSWLRITAGAFGVGTRMITLRIDANTVDEPRTGTITLAGSGGATMTVTQEAASCTTTLSETTMELPSAGGTGAVVVTSAACGYTAVPPPQVTITSGATGAGAGTVQFTVQPNTSTLPRTLSIQVGTESFDIEQSGLPCSTSVSGSVPLFDAAGGSSSIDVTAAGPTCDWNSSSSAPWLIVTSGLSGTGNGSVAFVVTPNASLSPRSAMVTVGPHAVQVNQAGTACTYALRSANGNVPAIGANGAVDVVAPGACTWTATSDSAWLGITAFAGAGTGSANFTAQPNPTTSPRTGILTVAGLPYTVTQLGAACTVTLPTAAATVANTGTTGTFGFTTSALGCNTPVQSFSNWMSVTGSLTDTTGSVDFVVEPNPLATTRVGRIVVGDQSYTITQLGAACAYSLAAYSALFGQPGGSGDLLASGSAVGCSPTVGSSPEITLGVLSFLNNIFTQPYTVEPFISSVPWVRTTRINFSGVLFTVKQKSW